MGSSPRCPARPACCSISITDTIWSSPQMTSISTPSASPSVATNPKALPELSSPVARARETALSPSRTPFALRPYATACRQRKRTRVVILFTASSNRLACLTGLHMSPEKGSGPMSDPLPLPLRRRYPRVARGRAPWWSPSPPPNGRRPVWMPASGSVSPRPWSRFLLHPGAVGAPSRSNHRPAS